MKTRVVSATNKDLWEMVRQGGFRADLYYRLAVVKIELPPLSRRPEDIVALARYFLSRYNAKFGKSFIEISGDALDLLTQRQWAGNVRELKNVIERAVLLGNGPALTSAHLGLPPIPDTPAGDLQTGADLVLPDLTPEGTDLNALLSGIEKKYYQQALSLSRGNVSKAARLLHMSRDQFRYRFKAR